MKRVIMILAGSLWLHMALSCTHTKNLLTNSYFMLREFNIDTKIVFYLPVFQYLTIDVDVTYFIKFIHKIFLHDFS